MKSRARSIEVVGAGMVASLIFVALLAPVLAPHDPARAVANSFGDPAGPSWSFPLGTDELGRDVLSRIIFGARISLEVGIAAMAVTTDDRGRGRTRRGFLRRQGGFCPDAFH